MSPLPPDGTTPGRDPRRPRIRPAQSENWDPDRPARIDAPADGRPAPRALPHPTAPYPAPPASPPAFPAPPSSAPSPALQSAPQPGAPATGHFTGPDGLACFRAADGSVYFQASDGQYYPLSALDRSATGGTGQTGHDRSDVDRSTYYEYIAAHTGEQPNAVPGTHPAPGAEAPAGSGSGGIPTRDRGGRRSGPRILLATVAGVSVLAIALVLGGNFLGPDNGIRSTEMPSDSSQPQTGAGTGHASGSTDSAATAVAAGEQLRSISEDDTARAMDELQDRWVVQLSAKQDGLRTEGRTWTEEDILEEFEQNRTEHPEAMLLWSGDWSTFRFNDYWITVLDTGYEDPQEALAHCRELGIDRDHCFAKKLSTTEGPDEATKLNP